MSEQSDPTPASPATPRIMRGFEYVLFNSRWLMAPFYVGLVVALAVLLLTTIFYKYATLTELPDIIMRLSHEQSQDFRVTSLLLMALFIVCVFGALAFSAALLTVQLDADRRRRLKDLRAAKARRLRWAPAAHVAAPTETVTPRDGGGDACDAAAVAPLDMRTYELTWG